jgi:S1-C subfamily serine protease
MAALAAGVQRSVVRVISSNRGVGAGTVWHSDGLIITNAHVVGRSAQLSVETQDGRMLPAKLLAIHPERDLAALMVNADSLPTIQPGDSHSLQPGAFVMALGHPWGVMNAATSGVVIGVGRHFPEMPPAAQDWVVVSLHLRPGHSGGPLVDVQGRLVGVNTMITGPDVGIAVAVDEVKAFLRETLGSYRAQHIV